jgi:hypothetical protein
MKTLFAILISLAAGVLAHADFDFECMYGSNNKNCVQEFKERYGAHCCFVDTNARKKVILRVAKFCRVDIRHTQCAPDKLSTTGVACHVQSDQCTNVAEYNSEGYATCAQGENYQPLFASIVRPVQSGRSVVVNRRPLFCVQKTGSPAIQPAMASTSPRNVK